MYSKQYYRDKVEGEFEQLSRQELGRRSRVLVERLIQGEFFKVADTVMAYLPLKDEVNIQAVFKAKKKFCVPKIKNGLIVPVELFENEEVQVKDIDLVIVPGRAFTKQGIRIGRGLGLYDRFLATLPDNIPTVSLAFDFQLFLDLPLEEHDRQVSKVITEA